MKIRKKWLNGTFSFYLILCCFFSLPASAEQAQEKTTKTYTIGITKIVSHPGIDAIEEGFLQTMNAYAKEKNVQINYNMQNAQGDMGTSSLIAKKFAGDNLDLIFSISTPSTQQVVKATNKTNIVFGAVTDPLSAGVVKSLESPGGNVTGVSDVWPIKKQIELLLKLVPSVKKIGLIYNPGESNASFMLGKLQEACDQLGLKLITKSIANTSEVYLAAISLATNVDAFYSSIDNTVLSAISTLVKVANKSKKPIIAGESDSVQKGAIATLGSNYNEIGKESGSLAIKILQGAHPGDLPVVSNTKTDLYLNMNALNTLKINVPAELAKEAKVKY